MPTQQFALERNGPKRLEVSWSGLWKEFTVKLDGNVVGSWTKDELTAGKEVPMGDGSTFKAHLRRVGMGQELALLRNGEPLPGSAADPLTLVKTAGGVIYFLAGASALGGVIGLMGVDFAARLFGTWDGIVTGAIMGVLGFFTMQRSRVALGIAMGLYALSGLLVLAESASNGNPAIGGIFMRVFFLTAMWRGFKAMGQLKPSPAPEGERDRA
ncbi:MAG: hypothetical protein IPJ65_43875 [Archangiaceae bacterium]|nr:hypothetical protein [Archangiaceae bacterium]